ncbi:MAG: hypothetical protein ACLQDY_10035 [Streptosporangiaceae bacterium]
MSYGHAERNLAAIRQLEIQTAELLTRGPQPAEPRPQSAPVPPAAPSRAAAARQPRRADRS